MKNPDVVFRELGQLYEFHKKIQEFRFREKKESLVGQGNRGATKASAISSRRSNEPNPC